MLGQEERDGIARRLRREYEARPKGQIPPRLWTLLLDIERATDPRYARRQGARSP